MTRLFPTRVILRSWIILVVAGGIVVVAARVGVTRGHSGEDHRDRATLDVGDRVEIPGVKLSTANLNLIVGTSLTCPACENSVGFYRELQAFAATARVPLYFLQGEHEEATWLDQASSNYVHAIHIKPSSIGIIAIPTFAVVDRDGMVKAIRIGSVALGAGQSTIEHLVAGTPDVATPFRNVTENEVTSWRLNNRFVQVLDVRDPGQGPAIAQVPGALAMPTDDLRLRSRYELDRRQPVVVDCRPVGRMYCQAAMIALRERQFTSIAGIDYSPKTRPYWGRIAGFVRGFR